MLLYEYDFFLSVGWLLVCFFLFSLLGKSLPFAYKIKRSLILIACQLLSVRDCSVHSCSERSVNFYYVFSMCLYVFVCDQWILCCVLVFVLFWEGKKWQNWDTFEGVQSFWIIEDDVAWSSVHLNMYSFLLGELSTRFLVFLFNCNQNLCTKIVSSIWFDSCMRRQFSIFF